MTGREVDDVPLGTHVTGLRLDRAEILAVLGAATRAPSVHNTQPWRFRLRSGTIDVLRDPERWLRVADPDGREQRLACGAAVRTLRLALIGLGHRPFVTLHPDRTDPWLMATVRRGSGRPATVPEQAMLDAIGVRRTQRTDFGPGGVTPEARLALRRAAIDAGVWLDLVAAPEVADRLGAMARRAYRTRMDDPAFRAEVARWTSWADDRHDGVAADLGGPAVSPSAVWLPGGARPADGQGLSPSSPLLGFVSTHADGPAEEVRAGEGLQSVLLAAAAHGLSAAFLSELIDVEPVRTDVHRLLGRPRRIQAAIRLGVATASPPTPRRPVEDVLTEDSEPLPPV
ncbi:Dinucleotide-utilizing enzyme involved in molybdopterin and thiamine biosynthesis family 2 [Pseudonocardia sp. Ae168_Ps1]|nr:Dinucleotide-utilizing enzyme involved in molybdopterin and thiamine biosynthesis family 2 [Pseudonocardia sp. Ae150A_Ps1]OLL78353.1 Dinucleotide-utilizing enzyme involved in molybdopterin and thiamine biosynthesis family 2 [Pseudonocardia sp. Ae168_Ps1]OLL87521.1 Dinucleotide-utilizing enzyme involved in molybdopterin and thiamine biosynthesis family 2 [Pseudonocardia sp. Ae263_Ps1]OLL92449.1 Dinucleotide-utilizing enzyme involved in molybdopterin and thiamine biosynthesis family 2 [Pseudono